MFPFTHDFQNRNRKYSSALLEQCFLGFKEQWHKTFGQPRGYDARYIHDESYGVKETPDGGYVVTGGTGDEYKYTAWGRAPRK